MEQEKPQPPNITQGEEVPHPTHIKEEDEELQPPLFKEEEEEHGISHNGDHLERLEEVDVPKMPLTGVIVKSEDDEVKSESEEKREVEPPGSSSTQHMTTEADGDHCGGSLADKLLAPLSDSDDTMSHSPHTEDKISEAGLESLSTGVRSKVQLPGVIGGGRDVRAAITVMSLSGGFQNSLRMFRAASRPFEGVES
ncbi:uncharacterized protein LOC133663627 isoform X2 [Entelurus aequoreus]|uniref:uncharacterized protein LOC133663627 isoform X2 n=1 Tax=Entelurus aequoreus TaxID=161455 RepID=UPI002B1E47A8|nr:uncharacterized protein LOC133663627 isoform X2 [Entelurus aequoreus]